MKSLKNIRKKKLKLNKHKQKYFVESDDQSDLSDEVSVISRESSSSDNNATPEYLTIKDIGNPSANSKAHSSNREESHSFYSEIDFSKENIWGSKSQNTQNMLVVAHNDKTNEDDFKSKDTHKIHPVHRGTPSFDDIPLKKVHKPFGEILDIELK